MDKDTINRTIAEAIGWRDFYQLPVNATLFGEMSGRWTGTQPDGLANPIPQYTDCLNAMNSAEVWLRGTDEQYYRDYSHQKRFKDYQGYVLRMFGVSATSSQRAEAFLRTLNLWQPPTGEENE